MLSCCCRRTSVPNATRPSLTHSPRPSLFSVVVVVPCAPRAVARFINSIHAAAQNPAAKSARPSAAIAEGTRGRRSTLPRELTLSLDLASDTYCRPPRRFTCRSRVEERGLVQVVHDGQLLRDRTCDLDQIDSRQLWAARARQTRQLNARYDTGTWKRQHQLESHIEQ